MESAMNKSAYTIREATQLDAEGITFVHVNSWKTSYAGIVDQAFLNNISYEKRLASRKEIFLSKDSLHLVALLDAQSLPALHCQFIRMFKWVKFMQFIF